MKTSKLSLHLTSVFLVISAFFMFGLSEKSEAWWMWTPGDTVDNSSLSIFSEGYKPPQPVKFSHKLHAGDRQISCQYCHSSARRSQTAGIPPSNTCMGCHKFVATDKPDIKFITEKYANNQPIEWIKVHDIPDHVRFTHQPHVAAKIACQECHGAVEKMDVVEQVAPMQMGWCLDCHRERNVATDCLKCHH